MAGSDFDIRLKKEAKTSLQAFRNQSLLRRKFGDDAVKLYDMIDSTRTVSEILAQLHMGEGKFVEILEFMNNNGMVSAVQAGEEGAAQPSGSAGGIYSQPSDEDSTPQEGAEGAMGEEMAIKGSDETGAIKPMEPGKPSGKTDAKMDVETLSPLEKILYDKYGAVGVKIYNLIDGEKTAEEILKVTAVTEAKLVEILEFMDEQGHHKARKARRRRGRRGSIG